MQYYALAARQRDIAPPRPPRRPPGWRRQPLAVGVAVGLYMLPLHRGSAEDYADYRFESYQEDAGRIAVDTQSWLFETGLTPWLSLKGTAVYDAISGATPTGAPTPSQAQTIMRNALGFSAPGTPGDNVPVTPMTDKRWAGSMDAELTLGPHHLTPEFSYSSEHDYRSDGAALNYSLDLNGKNTTLNAGWAHDWDTVLPATAPYLLHNMHKDTDSLFVGINQLLSPKTVLTVDLSFAHEQGYLNDPYRGVMFAESDQFDLNNLILYPERRPHYRENYGAFISLTQYFTPLRGSLEADYRFYHDSYNVNAHTVDLAWHQKIGKIVLLSPIVRYYAQSAASFYGVYFPGDMVYDPGAVPNYYSSDYRLSRMETFTVGVDLNARLSRRFSLDASYERYIMKGLDGFTSPSAYPQANIFTLGARVWF